jgi:hypothetical protein
MNFATGSRNITRLLAIALIMTGAASSASAQALTPAAQPIALNATLGESLTLSLSANTMTIPLTAGAAANPGAGTVTATTTWVLKSSRTAVGLYAYFTTAASALSDGAGDNIPSSAFTIADNGGAAAALSNTIVGFGGATAALQLANVAITAANRAGTRNDIMAFNINLTTLPQLPAATYQGTLNIQAQATP